MCMIVWQTGGVDDMSLGKPDVVSFKVFVGPSWHHLLGFRKSSKEKSLPPYWWEEPHVGWGLDLKGQAMSHRHDTVPAVWLIIFLSSSGRCTYLEPSWESTKDKSVFQRWNSHGWICLKLFLRPRLEPWDCWPLCFYREGLILTLHPGDLFCQYLTFDYESPSTSIPLFARSSSLWPDYLTSAT